MHELELGWIQWIHEFRNPIFDEFFKLLNHLDTFPFFAILVPIIGLFYGWRVGLKLLLILLVSRFVNYELKHFFESPRPFNLDPSVGLIHVGGFGFPSGAAQTAALLSGLLIIYWKNKWRLVVGITFFILISLSRVYLGVHFPSDILGGWAVGFLLLRCVVAFMRYFERFACRNGKDL